MNRERIVRKVAALVILLFVFLAEPVAFRLSFSRTQAFVQEASDRDIAELGKHLIVGYSNIAEVLPLIERNAIGGVFLTARNISGRSADAIKAELELLQSRQALHGGRPLIVATDQEGGIVSRLSPPLTLQPSLRDVVATVAATESLETRVSEYANLQARELSELGVNVNFGPVVDLAGQNDSFSSDEYSLLNMRAISAVPAVTTEVAMTYCRRLSEMGVIPTLKHFPGLGGVRVDTHRYLGSVPGTIEELERVSWLPFKQVSAKTQPFIMLGHVRVPSIDPVYPVSSSRKVVDGILRKRWGYNGILITDDFSMAPVYLAKGGPGKTAIRSLNAGVDLLLIGQRSEQLYPVLAALLRAKADGTLSLPMLDRSEHRLAQLANRLRHSMNRATHRA